MSTLLVKPITGSYHFSLHSRTPREIGTTLVQESLNPVQETTRGTDMARRSAENTFADVSTRKTGSSSTVKKDGQKNGHQPVTGAGAEVSPADGRTAGGSGSTTGSKLAGGANSLDSNSLNSKSVDSNGVDSSTAEQRAAEDRALVERAQRGESDAYRDLVLRYERRALAIAMGLLGNPEDARDLVQQAFLKAYRSLSSFRGQSSFYTWLYRIMVNLSIDFSRKAYRRAEQGFDDANLLDTYAQRSTASPDDYLGHLDGPEQRLQRLELRSRLEQALSALSNEHRTVIILREIEGLSYTEISEAVGCSKGTVMSRLHHARKRLQKALGDLRPADEGNSRSAADDDLRPADDDSEQVQDEQETDDVFNRKEK